MELVTHTLSPIIYTSKTCCHTELNTGLQGREYPYASIGALHLTKWKGVEWYTNIK